MLLIVLFMNFPSISSLVNKQKEIMKEDYHSIRLKTWQLNSKDISAPTRIILLVVLMKSTDKDKIKKSKTL